LIFGAVKKIPVSEFLKNSKTDKKINAKKTPSNPEVSVFKIKIR